MKSKINIFLIMFFVSMSLVVSGLQFPIFSVADSNIFSDKTWWIYDNGTDPYLNDDNGYLTFNYSALSLAASNKTNAGGIYLYNSSDSMFVNESVLNSTIDARASGVTYTAGYYLYLLGNEFNLNETELNATIDARDTDTDTTCDGGTCTISNLGTIDGINGSQIMVNTGDTLDFYTNNTFRGNINVNGYLGIGTNSSSSDLSPISLIEIEYAGDGFPIYKLERISAITKTNRSWEMTIGSSGSYTVRDETGGNNPFQIELGVASNTLVIDSASRVGIGTDNPSTKLEVIGNINASVDVCEETSGNCLTDISSLSTPGVCSSGKAVQNTTTAGVECINISAESGFTTVVSPLNSSGTTIGWKSCPNTFIYVFNSTFGGWQCQQKVSGGGGGTVTSVSGDGKYVLGTITSSGSFTFNETKLNITITSLDTDTTYTAGDALTLTGTDFDFDGGASPGGELGGTWASPTVDSSIHDDEYIELGDNFIGDVSGTYNATVVADDSHNHVYSNIDAFTEANLYTILSDVTQFYEAGDKVGDADTLDTHDTSYFQIALTDEASLYTALSDVSQFWENGDSVTGAIGSNEAYSSGWNADTSVPEKDDIYDYLHQYDTDDDGSLTDETWFDLDNISGTNEAGLYGLLSDVSEFIETNDAATLVTLNTGNGAYELFAMNQDVETTDAVTFITLDTGQGANELYDMDQNVLQASAVTFATLDTGFGANELYDMNQHVLTTSVVDFATVNTGQGDNELYDMNQNVLTTSDVVFENITSDLIKLSTDATNHQISDNSTCIIITGDTSTLSIC